jgi:uncharacterized phage infection (PIP) family protein YhgE
VGQSDLDLKIWKELAISKQLLIKTATDALGLPSECGDDELKVALEESIKKVAEADARILAARVENEVKLADIQKQLRNSELARKEADESNAKFRAAIEIAESALADNKVSTAQEVQSLKATAEEKTKTLKRVQMILADTPENVVKKLKALNKKKFDETTARKRAEDDARSLKKAKQELQAELDEITAKSEKLTESLRELKDFSEDQYTQLKGLVEDEAELKSLPEIDDELLGKDDEDEAEAA